MDHLQNVFNGIVAEYHNKAIDGVLEVIVSFQETMKSRRDISKEDALLLLKGMIQKMKI